MRTPYETCPLCGSADHFAYGVASCRSHPLWREPLPDEIVWHRCRTCDHLFTSGYFTAEAEAILFAVTNDDQRPGYDLERKRFVWASTVERIADRAPVGAWLDVGFGDGAFMFVADELGIPVHGVDTRTDAVDAMSEFGMNVSLGTLADISGVFAAVTMFDVLEHTPYPADELRHAHDRLVDGGLLVVSCPNAGSKAWEFLNVLDANPYWGEIEHYHNFTRARLVDLLAECGFVVESCHIADRFRLGVEIIARRCS